MIIGSRAFCIAQFCPWVNKALGEGTIAIPDGSSIGDWLLLLGDNLHPSLNKMHLTIQVSIWIQNEQHEREWKREIESNEENKMFVLPNRMSRSGDSQLKMNWIQRATLPKFFEWKNIICSNSLLLHKCIVYSVIRALAQSAEIIKVYWWKI